MAGNVKSKVAIPSRTAISRVDSMLRRSQYGAGGVHGSGYGQTAMLNFTDMGYGDDTYSQIVFWAKITASIDANYYTADIYRDWQAAAASVYDSAVTLSMAEGTTIRYVSGASPYPNGTILPAVRDIGNNWVAIAGPIPAGAADTGKKLTCQGEMSYSWV
jgi:hypothetical protein